jgi:transposase
MRKAATIVLTEDERETLSSWTRAGTKEARFVQRARIILAAASGKQTTEIARKLGERPSTVSKWRLRFAQDRIRGLMDESRSGRPRRYEEQQTTERILQKLSEPPPAPYAIWNGRVLAESLGDVSEAQVRRVLRKQKIQLQRKTSWCISTDPEFGRKAADIVALYLHPPENAVVICVDEKPHIQALERAQGYLRLPDGRAVRGVAHEYKRHGTTTLFAALNVMTSKVLTKHTKRRRRIEFLSFMNEVVAENPDREIHVILDNLSTHKPKRDRWLQQHPNVHFHFTPTHASWLNLVECWFSVLSRTTLHGASFTSPRELRAAIDQFIKYWDDNGVPFQWTKAAVRPVTPKSYISHLRT